MSTTTVSGSQIVDVSGDVQLLLDRCRSMNCIYEGQSFSRSLISSACADPQSSDLALQEMLDKGLAVKTATGAYSLTSVGASTLHVTPRPTKQRGYARSTPEKRPPINKI